MRGSHRKSWGLMTRGSEGRMPKLQVALVQLNCFTYTHT